MASTQRRPATPPRRPAMSQSGRAASRSPDPLASPTGNGSAQQRTPGLMRDDTRTFLRVSSFIEAVGILCVLTVFLTGGFRAHGPTNSLGWICLIVAMGCLPTGSLFLLLGLAKWYEDRKRA